MPLGQSLALSDAVAAPVTPVGSRDRELARWFDEEIRVHATALGNWLRVRFPSLADRDDIVQEAFLRAWQARLRGAIDSPKAFLFTVARNHAIDLLKHRHRQTDLGDCALGNVLDETMDTGESVARAQELEILRQAVRSLPERCREVFELRRFHGLSHREIATRLGISERTVEVHHTNAMHKCVQFFQATASGSPSAPPAPHA